MAEKVTTNQCDADGVSTFVSRTAFSRQAGRPMEMMVVAATPASTLIADRDLDQSMLSWAGRPFMPEAHMAVAALPRGPLGAITHHQGREWKARLIIPHRYSLLACAISLSKIDAVANHRILK